MGAVVTPGSVVILRNPAWTRKSHTLLVLLTSILTRSRASRRRSLPPRRAYSRTSVSFMTRYGLGRIRSCEQSVCSAGVRRWREGLLARLSGAAEEKTTNQEQNDTEHSKSHSDLRGFRAGGPVPGTEGATLASLGVNSRS
jgi:hypothetical protein